VEDITIYSIKKAAFVTLTRHTNPSVWTVKTYEELYNNYHTRNV